MLSIMPDADVAEARIQPDAVSTLRLSDAALQLCRDAKAPLKLTDTAVQHGIRRLGARSVDDLGAKLGYKRLAFYRLRTGKGYRISLIEAANLASKLGLPFVRVFEQVDRG